MKKFAGILPFFAVLLSTSVFAAPAPRVELNCIPLEFDQPPIMSENRTLVPLRKIFESLGATVEWDDITRTACAKKEDRTVSITIGTNQLIVDNETIELDVPAKIVNNRTLVPLRAISEAFDCEVLWDGNERLVDIFDESFNILEKVNYTSDSSINFSYFTDSEISVKSDSEISVKSGNVSVTITKEPSDDVLINDQYIKEIKKGLENFSSLEIGDVRKSATKNLLKISCHNKGNTIHYVYAHKDGVSYNLALTAPDGYSTEDFEKISYVLKTFENNF